MATAPPGRRPGALTAIETDAEGIGTTVACDEALGGLVRTLAAAKPGGRALELGTGVGAGTAWLLAGLDPTACLDTLDDDARRLDVARNHHGHDPRVTLYETDVGAWLEERLDGPGYHLVLANSRAGRFTHLDEALSLVERGGFYVAGDLACHPPGASLPEDHCLEAEGLLSDLESREGWEALPLLGWSRGVMVLVRR